MHHPADLTTLAPQQPFTPFRPSPAETLTRPRADTGRTQVPCHAGGLHPMVYRLVAGAFFWMLLVFALVFAGSPEAVFMVAICAVYFAVYFGTPWLMARLGGATPTGSPSGFSVFLKGEVETATGRCSATAALYQILSIPVALAVLCTAIGITVVLIR